MEPLNKRHVLFLLAAGAVIIPICSFFQQTQPAPKGEYHFSMFLRNNLTVLAWIVYAIAGFAGGYFLRTIHPVWIGVLLFLIFPLVSIIEGIVYRGSHNLLPAEFIMHFVYSLPSALAAFAGRLLSRKR
jgi:hypothetical protein